MQINWLLADKERNTKFFPYLLGFLAITSFFGYFMLVLGFNSLSRRVEAREKPSIFSETAITAKSAIVLDMSTGKVLFEKEADAPMPLASITKVMTALVVEEKGGSIKEVPITDMSIAEEGDSGLLVNSKWDLHKLLDYSLLTSSNDGASALALAVGGLISEGDSEQNFVSLMNAEAVSIGLSNSKFFNEHGLDRGENYVGSYGSARDVAKLMSYILNNHPNLLESTKYPEMVLQDQSGIVYIARNTNISINQIPGLLASKTGYTDLAGGNLVIAFDAGLGRPVIISVLGSTQEGRFSDVLKLASTTLEYIKEN